MGIEGFNTFIKNRAPNAMSQISAIQFSNTAIAIDAHNFIYANMNVSVKRALEGVNLRDDLDATHDNALKLQYFLSHILNFIITLTSYSITPIFVLDGPNIEGKIVRIKRREKNKKAYENIKEKEDFLRTLDPLERTDEDIEDLRKKKGSVTHVSEEEMNLLKDVLRSIGIPTIQADGDGEHICCMMVREGLASAVYSRDTDCMVYGCPLMLKKLIKNSGDRYHSFEVTEFAPILKSLKLSYSSFVDLCIMSQCDYNQNIPRVAIARSYELIKKYHSIEGVAANTKLDIECLNHEVCRYQFRRAKAVELLHPEHGGVMPPLTIQKENLKSDNARRLLRMYDSDARLSTLVASYRNIGRVVNRSAEKISSEGRAVIKGDGILFIRRIVNEPDPTIFDDDDDDERVNLTADNPLDVFGLRANSVESFD